MSIAAAAAGEERGNKFISIQTCHKKKKRKCHRDTKGKQNARKEKDEKVEYKKERLNGLFHLKVAC